MKIKKDTKAEILKASKELFSQKGINSTGMRDIASIVGIKQSAIYNHYKNKESIVNAVIDDLFLHTLPQEKDIALASKGKSFLRDYIVEFKILCFDKAREKEFKIVMKELYNHEKIRNDFKELVYGKHLKYLSKVFFTMMQDNLIKSSDPYQLSSEFFSHLLMLKFEITLFKLDDDTQIKFTNLFEKHLDFFWENISL